MSPMTSDQASAVALQAAAWLAAETDRLGNFLSATGMDPAVFRNVLDLPETQAAILDFVLMDDAWVLDCAASSALDPHVFQQARAVLPGGSLPHWT